MKDKKKKSLISRVRALVHRPTRAHISKKKYSRKIKHKDGLSNGKD